jgi:hypothetical protein
MQQEDVFLMATITNLRSNEHDSVLERMLSTQDRNDHHVRHALGWALSRVPGVQQVGHLVNELVLEQLVVRSSAATLR